MLSGLESPLHLLVVLVIAMLVLGPKRLPQMARSLGSGIREFKSSISGEGGDEEGEEDSSPDKPELPSAEVPRPSPDTPVKATTGAGAP